MSVDGKSFSIYELDSEQTILERIAVSKKITPEYIKILSRNERNDIVTLNLIDLMETYKPHELEKFFSTFHDDFPLLPIEKIAKLWYVYKLKEGKEGYDMFVQITLDEYLKKNSPSNLNKIIDEVSSFKREIIDSLVSLNKKIEKDLEDFKTFSSLEPISSTPVEVVKVKSELTFEVEYDIYELFNYMKMSREIPFATIGSYYKILEGFTPSRNWTYAMERLEGDFGDKNDVLYIKTLNTKNEPPSTTGEINPQFYSTISIYFETPQEEIRRKREERLQREEERERERKKREKKRKEEEKEEREKAQAIPIRRKKPGVPSKSVDEIRKEREAAIKEREKARREKERQEKEEEEQRRRKEEEEESERARDIVRTSKVYMRFESDINPDLSEEELIVRVLDAFPSRVNILTRRQVHIKGEFMIPNFYLDRPLFLDAVMNERLFYTRCFVDERAKIQKEKGGVYIYFAFNASDPEDKYVSCSMTEQVVEKTNLKLIGRHPELKVDAPYLRVRITKVDDEEEATRFKTILTKLFTHYIKIKDNILEKYEEYLPDISSSLKELRTEIETKRKKSTRTREMLKDIDPDQFISGYSRWLCPTKRAPRIVGVKDPNSEEEPDTVKEIRDEKGMQVILFPKNPEEDGQKYNQYYYSCDHHEGKGINAPIYPGLRINALSNSDKYPIVPCCYAKDHFAKEKGKSILRLYYEDDKNFSDFKGKKKGEKKDEDEDEKDEKHIYTTNKIVPLKRLGILAKDVDYYFKSIDINYQYYRQGVSRTFNSIIEVLLMATNKEFDLYTKEEREEEVQTIREKMAEMVSESDVYQQTAFYSREPQSIENYIRNKNKYFDPKMFTRLLEEYFKCYLFIFSQNNQYPFGILSSPYHLNEYLTYRKKEREKGGKMRPYPTVFIYEHMGSELDRLDYPQCELIVRVDPEGGEKKSVFENNFKIVQRTEEIFTEMYVSDRGDTDIVISFQTPLSGQGIDFYGKARFLEFATGVCILTDPLPPLQLPVKYNYKKTSKEKAMKFLSDENIKNVQRHVVAKNLVGFYGEKGFLRFYIPIMEEETSLPNEKDIISPSFLKDKSEMNRYNDLHRLARYLSEYTLYLFSIYYKENEGEIDSSYIVKFARENIEIDRDFVYGKVPRVFSLNSGVLRNKKLVVPNETVLKKLIYTLRVRLRNNENEVKRYSEYKYIQRYYADVKDFDQLDTQLIIYGQNALIRWIENVKRVYKLHSHIVHAKSSLLSEISKHDTSKPFVVVFYAAWNKESKSLLNRIVAPKGAKKGKYEGKDLMTIFGQKVNFVYVDIDSNKGIASEYNIDNIPYIYVIDLRDGKYREVEKIKGVSNTTETVNTIKKVLDGLLQ